jgi:hypothetical protein
VEAPAYSARLRRDELEMRLHRDLKLLAASMRAGDKEAFFLGLRFRETIGDSVADRERLDQMLGEFVRISPKEFLEGLARYGAQRRCRDALGHDVDAFAD